MMRPVLLIAMILTLFVDYASAQDFQMVRSDRIAYFIDPDVGVKCIRIDSIDYNGDTVLIPMSNIQYVDNYCVTPFAPSWIGEKIIMKGNGDHLFLNKNNDTILLKTQADLHEPWLCFTNSNFKIEAAIVLYDTLSFLGIRDSVKTIAFQVYDEDQKPMHHDLNNLKLNISKDYGLVKTLNFYLFPDYEQMNYGFIEDGIKELNLAGQSNPELGIQNLTWFDVHDFSEGDELHISYEWSDWDFYYSIAESRKTIKKYLGRMAEGNTIQYRIERKVLTHKTRDDSSSVEFIHDTITETINPNPEFDKLPGEPIIREYEAYSNFQTGSNMKTIPPAYLEIWRSEDSCWNDCCLDGCFEEFNYYNGLGGPYGSCRNAFSGGGMEEKLEYYKKGEQTWGTPFILTWHDNEDYSSGISVYPNPASDFIMIQSSKRQLKGIHLIDLAGKIVHTDVLNSNNYRLNVTNCSPGIYFLIVESAKDVSNFKIEIY